MSSTSFLLSGSAGAFLAAPGAGKDVVVVSSGGRVPETGAIGLAQAMNATRVPGVLAYSFEVYAPVESGGSVAVVRGVDYADFSAMQPTSVVAGSAAAFGNGTALVGAQLARVAGVKVGETLAVSGVLADSSAALKVVGIVSAGTPFDSEILTTLSTARSLRGLSPDQATFLRLKVDPAVFSEPAMLAALGAGGGGAPKPSNPYVQQLQLAPYSILVSIEPQGGSPSLATELAGGAGIVQSVLSSLDILVLAVSLFAVYFATAYWLQGAGPTSDTLAALGMGRRRRFLWLAGASVPLAAACGALGYVAAYWGVGYLSSAGALSFFFQPLLVAPSIQGGAASTLGPALAVLASLAYSFRAVLGRGD
ncbi:MAG: hypothetical protein JRM89_03295 [Nitrososphaerota archaeon]|nr:hypothetical protein [Nitrososphaerota archaeon]MDG7014996.1 hypothetical protein [Nitrososphaerota archaeon]WGO50951.1 MAG: hypothetical protein JRM93_02760 [Nitrososphaerota archaeon]